MSPPPSHRAPAPKVPPAPGAVGLSFGASSQAQPPVEDLARLLPEDPTGIKVWRNRKNAFTVCSLHYTADPRKRDPLWREETKKGMPVDDWEREYELNWETHAGKPVYGADFNEMLHVSKAKLNPIVGLPMIRGWDFGLTPACAILQLVGKRVYVLDEVLGDNMGAARFVPQVLNHCKTFFGGFEAIDFVDPAGFNRSESEEVSCVSIMSGPPFHLSPTAGEMTYEKRLGAVIEYLTRLEEGRPLLQISPNCQVLIAGFKGGYQYPEPASNRSVIRMDRPLKNAFSHVHDALQYAMSKLVAVRSDTGGRRLRLVAPSYGFQGSES